ncbi:MAG: HemK/PrmC family methyltransferase, partial [Pseudomonadota bacterium]
MADVSDGTSETTEARLTFAQAVCMGTKSLRNAGIDDPRRTARRLLCHALGVELTVLLRDSAEILTAAQEHRFRSYIDRRINGETPARIEGVREFWSLPFQLSAGTLEPRPETETLVEAASHWMAAHEPPVTILDFGTGTGCILLSLLHEHPGATGVGVDISEDAIQTASKNAENLGLSERTNLIHGDWALPDVPRDIRAGNCTGFDLILSNPP